MKLIRFGEPGGEKPGVLLPEGARLNVTRFTRDFNEDFFGGGGVARLAEWLGKKSTSVPRVPARDRLGPPIARPSKIICIGLNYSDHAAETGNPIPPEPVIFFKATSSLVGPNDTLVIPKNASKVDWEVELAIIIGAAARYVPKKKALDYIAGYALHNDYSERSFQLERGGQWVKGKSADTFAPLGPFLATRDEIPNPHKLSMWLKVNGEFRQKSTTANMIFDVPNLVSYVSEFMTLLPGDVISTGTPAGVGMGMKPATYVKAGDVMELGIEGLGESRQQAIDWNAAQQLQRVAVRAKRMVELGGGSR